MLPLLGEPGPCAAEGAATLPSAPTWDACRREDAPGRWLGVVLCGGASARMGRDKARLEVDGEPLYARAARVLGELCAEVVLASGPAARLGDRRWREVADAPTTSEQRGERQGPLAALVAGLALAAREGFDGVVVAPCDTPRLAAAILAPLQLAVAAQPRAALQVHDAAQGAPQAAVDVAHWRRDARDEPLCAALSVRALPALAAAFERGVRRPVDAYSALRAEVREAPAALAEALTNVNTPAELACLGASTGVSA